MPRSRILLQACLNGSRRREEHPTVPLSSREIADAAARAVTAGAGSLHIHPRAADGSETLHPAACDAVVAAVREACPGVPVGLTTGLWIEPDLERRLARIAAWATPPDFVSLNMREPGAREVCDLLRRHAIGIEAGVWTVDDARRLAALGVADQCLRVLIEPQADDPAVARAHAAAIDEELDQLQIRVPRLHHGEALATWAVIERALDHGHDIRIGLEDTLQLPDGSLARDNVELIEAALAVMRRKVSG